jgi:peptidyl-prolyl cis-trans isomerase SurA
MAADPETAADERTASGMSWAHSVGRLTAGTLAALVSGMGVWSLAMAQTPAPALTQTQVSAPAPTQGPLKDPLSGGVAVIVNDDVISTYDLRQRALLLIMTSGVQPTQDNLPQIQEEALRSLVDERLEFQELHKMEKQQKFEIIAKDDDVQTALKQLAKDNNTTLDVLTGQFARAGLDIGTLRDQIKAQISWQDMIQGRYGSRVRVGSNQVNMAMQRLKANADKPLYQISEIFIDTARAGGTTEAVNGAQQLITQIQQGAPFAGVARQFSNDATAANGGDMGWVAAAELPAELGAAVEQMRPGQLSQPIPVADGVYVLQLRDKKSGAGTVTVNLKQAALRLASDAPADQVQAAQKTLEDFRGAGATCADLEAKAAAVPGLVAGDLGQSDVNDLSPEFRQAAESLSPNQFSEPIRTPVGLHLLLVCGRSQSQAKLPDKQEIEYRLYQEQLSMLSRRYLRDLRNSATIETP